MRNDFVEGVLEFNRAAGRPEEFNPRMVAFHIGMQLEELAEKLDAVLAGAKTDAAKIHCWQVEHMKKEMDALGHAFKEGQFDLQVENGDRHGYLDADVDIQVVTLGGMMTAGNDIIGAMSEVNRANLDKKFPDGTFHLHSVTGKVQKPDGWKAPDLTPYVVKQKAQ